MAKWKKGQSGNPGGRKSDSQASLAILKQKLPVEVWAQMMLDKCEAGEMPALLFVGERYIPKMTIIEAEIEGTETHNAGRVALMDRLAALATGKEPEENHLESVEPGESGPH